MTTLYTGDMSLNFFDSPTDSCLDNPNGTPSIAFSTYGQDCGRTGYVSAPGAQEFDTMLVGILPGDDPPDAPAYVPLPDTFTWNDTFNGVPPIPGYGGITFTDLAVDPSTGEGGIEITSVNGVSVSSVPEPRSIYLRLSGLLGMVFIYRIRPLIMIRRWRNIFNERHSLRVLSPPHLW
jgi:hypothetical protein